MLFRLLIFAILGVVIYRVIKSWSAGLHRPDDATAASAPETVDDVMIKDPVCGTYFPKRTAVVLSGDGRQRHFCSAACRDRFVEQQSETSSH